VLKQLTSEVIFDETPGREGENKYFVCNASATETSTRGDEHALFGHKIVTKNGEIDGTFVEWNWNGERLEVKNDHLGIYPLFYHASDNCVAVSSSLPELIRNGISAEKDVTAIGVFLRTGTYLGEDTPFKQIRALRPGATLNWRRGNFTITSSTPEIKRNKLNWDETVDGFIDLFRASMERRQLIHGQLALPLSGGRDSRLILLELRRLDILPEIFFTGRKLKTYSHSEDDVEIARTVANRIGCQISEVPLSPSNSSRESQRNQLTNFADIESPWMMAIADYLQRESIGTIYDGLNGGVLTGAGNSNVAPAEQLRDGNVEALARSMMRYSENTRELIDTSCHEELHEETSLKRICDELRKHCRAPDPERSFLFANRTRRSQAHTCYGLLRGPKLTYTPYLDLDLCPFLLGIDAELLRNRSLRTDAINRAYPAWSNIPYSRSTPRESQKATRRFQPRKWRKFLFCSAASLAFARLPKYCRRNHMVKILTTATLQKYDKVAMNTATLGLYISHLENV